MASHAGTPSYESLPGNVYERLRKQITDGILRPGQHLTEVSIAAEFGVSRTPVREAMSYLGWEGLLERRERGYRVRALDPEEVLEIYEVRIALERAAARAAANRRTDFDLSRLTHAVGDMKALDVSAPSGRAERAHAFHFALWRASHNATLLEALERLHVRVMGLASTTLHYPDRWETVLRECESLLIAITDQDVELSGEIVTTHLTRARDIRVQIYSRGGGSPTEELLVNLGQRAHPV